MSYPVCAMTRRALSGVCAVALGLSASMAPVVAQEEAAALDQSGAPEQASITVDELADLSLRAWIESDRELLEQAYAPDAVHTVTYYDVTTEFEGVDRIASVAMMGLPMNPVGPRMELPAPEGELRWASFVDLAGGSACLFRAIDGRIVRHDCLAPETAQGNRALSPAATGGSSMTLDELVELTSRAWSEKDMAVLEQAYAPDAVHSARFLNETRRYEGPEEIARVAFLPGAVDTMGPTVEFEAAEGEMAWASVADVGGGSLCLFRARDGQVVRHDCVLPISW